MKSERERGSGAGLPGDAAAATVSLTSIEPAIRYWREPVSLTSPTPGM